MEKQNVSILHIVPDSLANERKKYVGSSKDVLGRTEYFRACNIAYEEIASPERSDLKTLSIIRTLPLDRFDAVIFEYEGFLECLRFLKTAHPKILRITRAHNANLHHRLDMLRAAFGTRFMLPTFGATLGTLPRVLRSDRACVALSDYVLTISEHERASYWGRLGTPEKIVNVPYFLPESFRSEIRPAQKENICVCVMGTGSSMTPFLYDNGKKFVAMVAQLDDLAPSWRFQLTGNVKPANMFGKPRRLEMTGLVESPLDLVARSRAVAITSPFGRGFKTKILESILCGAYVIMPQQLYDRMPAVLRPYCVQVNVRSAASFASALQQIENAPQPHGDPNGELRRQAFDALNSILLRQRK